MTVSPTFTCPHCRISHSESRHFGNVSLSIARFCNGCLFLGRSSSCPSRCSFLGVRTVLIARQRSLYIKRVLRYQCHICFTLASLCPRVMGIWRRSSNGLRVKCGSKFPTARLLIRRFRPSLGPPRLVRKGSSRSQLSENLSPPPIDHRPQHHHHPHHTRHSHSTPPSTPISPCSPPRGSRRLPRASPPVASCPPKVRMTPRPAELPPGAPKHTPIGPPIHHANTIRHLRQAPPASRAPSSSRPASRPSAMACS